MVSTKLFLVEPARFLTSPEPMKDASEDEQEDNFISQPTETPNPKISKAERAERLRKMMEDDGNPPFSLSSTLSTRPS